MLLLFLMAYLVGSVPCGYFLIRAGKQVDIRDFGSHNIGAINVFRVGGFWFGTATLLLDAAKGACVVWLANVWSGSPWVIALCAWLVLLGHAYSAYFYLRERRFSEGKSVACSLGVLIALGVTGGLPYWLLPSLVGIWAGSLLLPRLWSGHWPCISPATILATVALPGLTWIAHPAAAYRILAIAMSALVLLRHKNNFRRLLAGTEPRLGERFQHDRQNLQNIQTEVGNIQTEV